MVDVDKVMYEITDGQLLWGKRRFLAGEKVALCDIFCGKTISFGHYPVQNANDIHPIVWHILQVEKNRVLLLSDCALEKRYYDSKFGKNTWENSSLRQWLNDDFFSNAFSDVEKKMICEQTISSGNNPFYDTEPGGSTKDKVFILSIWEALRYLRKDANRECEFVESCIDNDAGRGLDFDETCRWWLRSPGNYDCNTSFVETDGSIDYEGNVASACKFFVRPAIYVRLPL